MFNDGYTHQETAKVLLLDPDTITKCVRNYIKGGVEALTSDNFVEYSGKLTPEHEKHLSEDLEKTLFSKAAEVANHIKTNFGIKYSHDGTVKLLLRLGFVYKKTKAIPSKADKDYASIYQRMRKYQKNPEKG